MKNILIILLASISLHSCKNEASEIYLKGKQMYDEGNYQMSIDLLTKEIETNGGSDLAYHYRARANQKLGHLQKAIHDFNNALEINNELASAHVNRAVAQTKLKDYSTALEGLNYMINHFKLSNDSILNKNIGTAYNNRGLIKQHFKKDIDAALEDFNKSLSIEDYSKNALALMNRGRLYLIKNEYENAMKDLDSSLVLNNTNSLTYSIKSQVDYRLGNYEKALHSMNSAIELTKNRWEYYNQRGLVLSKLKNYKESISDFDKAIQLSDHTFPYNNRGFANYKLGNLNEALSDCKKSLQLNKENSWAYYNLGLIEYELGKKEKACSNFMKALDLGKIEAKIELEKKCK